MNTDTTSQLNQPTKGRRKLFNFFKIFFGIVFFLIIAGVVANWIWVRSGSNEWEKALDEDDIVVHTWKEPGKFLLQMKATKRIKSKLGAFVSVMQDVDAMCEEGCFEARIVKRMDSDTSQYVYTYSLFDMPFPFTDREWVLENKFRQDPETHEIIYKIDATPHIVPPKEGLVRITHFNNEWRFIPLGNGEVDVVWMADMDQGGYLVNLLFNLTCPEAMHEGFLEIEEMVQKKKYQQAKHDFVKEVEEIATAER